MLIFIFGDSKLLFEGSSTRIILLIKHTSVADKKGIIFLILQLQSGNLNLETLNKTFP